MTPALLDRLLAARAAGRPVVLATRLSDGAQALVGEDGFGRPGFGALSAAPGEAAALDEAVVGALREGVARRVEIGEAMWFLEPHLPPTRLLVVGAVHVAQMLARIAPSADLAVTVIDPRESFASEARFPGVALAHGWPDEAIASLRPDRSTAVVALTHDPKLDDPALQAALASEAFYVGALGSQRSHAKRLERLAALGCDASSLARVRGPVGLKLGAVSPGEIAVSILAEIVAVRRGASLGMR